MKTSYYAKIHILAIILVIFGSINWGLVGIFGISLIERLLTNRNHRRLLYIVLALSSLYIASRKTTWLPFLGKSVIPCHLLDEKFPKDATHTVKINVSPGAKVVYWAADDLESYNKIDPIDPIQAYGKVENSGITIADNNGIAELKFKYPRGYNVNRIGRKYIPPHVHFRVCESNLILGDVKTINL
jgi:uncharacterized membrane protein YuzA (DUF378 family)